MGAQNSSRREHTIQITSVTWWLRTRSFCDWSWICGIIPVQRLHNSNTWTPQLQDVSNKYISVSCYYRYQGFPLWASKLKLAVVWLNIKTPSDGINSILHSAYLHTDSKFEQKSSSLALFSYSVFCRHNTTAFTQLLCSAMAFWWNVICQCFLL